MKLLRWLLIVLTALSIAVAAVFAYVLYSPVPEYSDDQTVSGIQAPVELSFDDQRRPFVRARTLADAVYGQGWLHARERLWQMELLRRAGQGRLAQLLGASLLDTDRELWRVGVPQLAQRLAENAAMPTRRLLSSYVAGINAALASQPPPLEMRLLGAVPAPWSEADVFALGALMAFQSGRNMRNELLRQALVERLPVELASLFTAPEDHLSSARIQPPRVNLDRLGQLNAAVSEDREYFAPPLLGSNGWVIAPSRSASGHALFAFDSHDGWSMPNLFYEVHLFFADGRQVRGWSVPGLPGVVNGYNEFMAWGFTNIGDSQDLYLETRDPDNPMSFHGRAGWYDATVEQIDIPLKDGGSHQLKRIVTENGPLIQEDPPISLAWSAADPEDMGLDGLFALNTATSLDAFMAALDRFPAPSANATYADVDGNIVFRTVGRLPIRGSGKGLLPLSAQNADGAWRGTKPLSELPVRINPSSGYLVAANAAVESEFLVSADNAPGYRQARLHDLIQSRARVGFADMQRWQVDFHNTQAALLLPQLLEDLGADLDPALSATIDALRNWSLNPLNDADLVEPLLFARWYMALARAVFEPELGQELLDALLGNSYVLNQALDPLILGTSDSPWWSEQRRELVRGAFYQALSELDAGDLQWGAHHQLRFRHEMSGAVPGLDLLLNRGPYSWGGGNSSLGRARYRYDRPFTATGGATVRVVIEMSQPMKAAAVIPGGQSGHPGSGAYDDQFQHWLSGALYQLADDPPPVSMRLLPAP